MSIREPLDFQDSRDIEVVEVSDSEFDRKAKELTATFIFEARQDSEIDEDLLPRDEDLDDLQAAFRESLFLKYAPK